MVRTLDLFCGAGGSSYGAQKAGATIVAGIDIWLPATKVFKANFPNAFIYRNDIRELDPIDIKKKIGNIELLLASPECRSHSIAKGANQISKESRDTAFEIIRFAEIFKSKWIVIENVTGINKWERYSELINNLEELGYNVKDDIILNAADFGVPQSRKRRFILCSLQNKLPKIKSKCNEITPVSTIIDYSGEYNYSPLIKPGRAKSTINKANCAIESLGPQKPFLIVYYGSGKKGNGGWQDIDSPLRTITTIDRFALVVPLEQENRYKIRMLQPEELKLAMGYDKEFLLDAVHGLTRRERVKLMGNGVCPPVMKAIVESLV